MKKLTVVKLGGNAIDDAAMLEKFLEQFAKIPGAKILVHGGGKIATSIGKKLGIVSTMHNGRRVTSEQTLDVITMVYAGLLNKKIVAALQAIGCNALGLCGADGNLILAEKRSPVPIDFGFVGDSVAVNRQLLIHMLAEGYVPVIAPLTHDGKGQLLNTNADTIASVIASSLAKSFEAELIFAFEKAGVFENPEDENSLLDSLSHDAFRLLQHSGSIHSGMLPKLNAGYAALRNNVSKVTVKHLHALHEEKYTQLVL